ncbi:MAG: pilus assembly protein PilM [Phycisphaerae bacterium]|nr:pilus assembly protein PilM [Phycisphaerae bacterium]
MNTKQKHVLVLGFNEDSVAAAQASLGHDCYEIKHTAMFPMGQTVSWEDPEAFGRALHQFLRKEHISARATLVGVPAKWIVAKSIKIPPARRENMASLLQIQTEQAFSMNHHDLVFDYSAQISETHSNEVLLAAMKRTRLDQIKVLAKAAGLQLVSITPSVAAMGSLSRGQSQTCGIYAQNEHCEMVLASNGVIRQIKHMATPLNNKDPKVMAQDIQRLMLLTGTRTGELVVWSDGSSPSETVFHLKETLGSGMDVKVGRDALTRTGRLQIGQTSIEYDPALSLIAAQDQPDIQLIDFLNSRLVVKETDHKPRILVWSAVAALVVVVLAASLLYGWYEDGKAIKLYKQTLEDNAQIYKAVSGIRSQLNETSPWYTKRPQFLNCINDVVRAFPDEGNIWVSSLILKENGQGSISGEAVNATAVLNVLDKLNALETISDATPVGAISTSKSGNASFTIGFKFKSE